MADARDILLGSSSKLGPNWIQIPSEKPAQRPQKDANRKPEGISREVYALTGGLAPIITSRISSIKKQPNISGEKVCWKWMPFANSARKDGLKLYHWERLINGLTSSDDYELAKYNKKSEIVEFSKEEYEQLLQDPSWTFEETVHLFDLCKSFDLRFIVIADRFSSIPIPNSYKERSVEELKNRYYSILQKLCISRTKEDEKRISESYKEVYNMGYEVERKKMLHSLFSHSKSQEREENEVLNESKRIKESRKASQNGQKSIMKSSSKKQKLSKFSLDSLDVSESDLKMPEADEFMESSSQEDKPIALLSTPKSRQISVILSTPVPEQLPSRETEITSATDNTETENELKSEKTKSLAAISDSHLPISVSEKDTPRSTSEIGRTTGVSTPTFAQEKVKIENIKPPSVKKHAESSSPMANVNNIFEFQKLPGVFLRGEKFASSLTAVSNTLGVKMSKKIDKVLEDYSIKSKLTVPSRRNCFELVELKKDIVTLLSLQKRVQLTEEEKNLIKEESASEHSAPVVLKKMYASVNEPEKEKASKDSHKKTHKIADQASSKRKKVKSSHDP